MDEGSTEMNEKIKELAEQAGFLIEHYYPADSNFENPIYRNDCVEKFVNLLLEL